MQDFEEEEEDSEEEEEEESEGAAVGRSCAGRVHPPLPQPHLCQHHARPRCAHGIPRLRLGLPLPRPLPGLPCCPCRFWPCCCICCPSAPFTPSTDGGMQTTPSLHNGGPCADDSEEGAADEEAAAEAEDAGAEGAGGEGAGEEEGPGPSAQQAAGEAGPSSGSRPRKRKAAGGVGGGAVLLEGESGGLGLGVGGGGWGEGWGWVGARPQRGGPCWGRCRSRVAEVRLGAELLALGPRR